MTRLPVARIPSCRAVLRRSVTAVVALLLLALPTPALASQLLAPAVGAGDTMMNGSTVAEPLSPSGALFANPAGLTRFPSSTLSFSLGVPYGTEKIRTTAPAGYRATHKFVGILPDFGLVLGKGRWRYGVALFGSVGINNDFPADSDRGISEDFFSEVSVVTLAPGLAYKLSDHLSVGAAITPLFGLLRAHFPGPGLLFRYKLTGPGIQANAGLSWKPAKDWALGLGLRSPGMIWMDGSMLVPGSGRQNVSLNLEMPAQLLAGVTRQIGKRLSLSASFRWTDSSSFAGSTVEHELTPAANASFVPDAKDEWRFALGGDYVVNERLRVRLAIARATRIVGTRGVNPLHIDSEDIRLGGGVSLRLSSSWTLDLMVGQALKKTRRVPPGKALIFPGNYSIEGGIVMAGLTVRL